MRQQNQNDTSFKEETFQIWFSTNGLGELNTTHNLNKFEFCPEDV